MDCHIRSKIAVVLRIVIRRTTADVCSCEYVHHALSGDLVPVKFIKYMYALFVDYIY